MKHLLLFGFSFILGASSKVDFSGLIYKDSTPLAKLPEINLYELKYKKSVEISETIARLQALQVEFDKINQNLENVKIQVNELGKTF